MKIAHSTPFYRTRRFSDFLKTSALVCLYLWGTRFLVLFLDPPISPPGFTGRGAYAMVLVLIGAFHIAGYCRSPSAIIAYGGFAAMLLLPHYLGDRRLSESLGYDVTIRSATVGWIIFVTCVALLARMTASVRWRGSTVIADSIPKCKYCKYDLRESGDRCPECGKSFDKRDPLLYAIRVEWNIQLLGQLIAKILLGTLALGATWYLSTRWFSEQPLITQIQSLGGSAETESIIPRPWRAVIGPFNPFFEHITQVDLSDVTIHDDDLKILRHLQHLRSLYLRNSSVEGNGLSFLAKPSILESLWARHSKIDDGGAKFVVKCQNLREIDLSDTNITDIGIGELCSLTQVSSIYFERTDVSDKGLLKLLNMPALRQVFMRGSKVTQSGVKEFLQARPDVELYDDLGASQK